MATSTSADNEPPISSKDIVIAVIGATGVGKSSFINIAVGNDETIIGHDLRSCTQGVQAVRCMHPEIPDHQIVFLDTPGFDDTSRTDTEVLIDISEWLKMTYEKGIKLTGLLFLHRISDNRMTGTLQRNTHIFEMVCGRGALQNVILVTTMWNTIDTVTGSQREEELRTDFWQSMITSGSRIARFESTYQSAWDILNQFTGDALPLLLQKEMVEEKKTLPQTTAGSAHFQWLRQLVAQFRDIFVALRRLFPGLPKRSGTGGGQQQGLAGEKMANSEAEEVVKPSTLQLMPSQMGDILPVTKDPCNWFLFAYPDNSHYDTALVELANSSRRSFEIIELWQKQRRINSSRHPLISEMIDNIAKQGPGYYRAIQKSAETARRGCSFASDAIDFCKRLLKAEDSVETLKAGLDDIKEVAKYAHQDAQETYHQFKEVRVELFKILKDIPSGALSSQTDKNVLAQFEQASNDLGSLIQNVGSFVNWWGDMNMSLTNLEEILPQVRVDGTNPFRTDTVTERWKAVHKNYVWYRRQIGEVEDYYKNVSADLTPCSNFKEIVR